MDFDMKEIGSSLVLLAVGVGTGVLKWNRARSKNKKEINQDRSDEKETGLRVDLLESMRTDRIEAFRQRDLAQEQAQAAWAHQIEDAKAIARLEAENAYLKHELAGVRTALSLMQSQIALLKSALGRLDPTLAKQITTDFGALNQDPS